MLSIRLKLSVNSFFLLLFVTHTLLGEAKITYGFSGGRLGDHLIAYLHAKWISYEKQLPLLYIPFEQSDAFLLHELENPLPPHQNVTVLKNLSLLDRAKDLVYQIPYAPDYLQEYQRIPGLAAVCPFIKVDWEDKAFIECVRPFLSPRFPIETIPLPKDKITVALHIRRTVGVDVNPKLVGYYPYKFLPDQFYLDQIRWVYEEMGKKPLYVYLFSNDPDIGKVAEQYKNTLNLADVTFDWGKGKDVLTDFYSMMCFDCLIRPQSNLSIVASKFGYQKLVISPEHVNTNRRGILVDKVKREWR